MLLEEWNIDDAKEVWHEEGREDEKIDIARNALAEGLTPEIIQKITGLSEEDIKELEK